MLLAVYFKKLRVLLLRMQVYLRNNNHFVQKIIFGCLYSGGSSHCSHVCDSSLREYTSSIMCIRFVYVCSKSVPNLAYFAPVVSYLTSPK